MIGARTADAGPRRSLASTSKAVVFIVDDDISIRDAVAGLVSLAGWCPVAFASAEAFLSAPRARIPSCLVLDVHLPKLDGLELQQAIAVAGNEIPIVFITGNGDVPMTVRAMKAGATEFLTKPFDNDVLLEAIRNAVAHSEAVIGREVAVKLLKQRYEQLSPREREVMALVAAGLLNKQVGGELGISEITVKAHRGRVMRKMQAASLADLVRLAEQLRQAA